MSRSRYSGYHGRPGARNILKGIAGFLAIVLVLVLAGLLIGQRYLVYTDDGVRLELPFFQREEPQPDTNTPVNIVQVPGISEPEREAQEETGEQPEPEVVPEEKSLP